MISSLTYDDTRYRFTNAAAPAPVIESPADVTGSFADVAKQKKHAVKVKVHLDSDMLPAGKVLGKRLAWKITVDGKKAFSTSQQFDDHDVWVARFANHTGKHKVRVYEAGHLVKKIVVRTGR